MTTSLRFGEWKAMRLTLDAKRDRLLIMCAIPSVKRLSKMCRYWSIRDRESEPDKDRKEFELKPPMS